MAGDKGGVGGAEYYDRIGLVVGLEIHQQLATGRKLFCGCRQGVGEEEEDGGGAGPDPAGGFARALRASKSETGRYDPAAVFESGKAATITYRRGAAGTSCLVEEDDEPPHDLDGEALRTSLIVAAALGSRAFRELFPMRKMVIDGSNTSGFQRTILVAQGGSLAVGGSAEGEKEGGGPVGVQSICLEEDAARLLGGGRGGRGGAREYCLDRLGVPLVEIALEPTRASPGRTRTIAVSLGRLLRASGRVARGIGTIRQDVNVSVGGGPVVEVKGVQQLDQLEKVVAFEARRQDGLNAIAGRLRAEGGPGGERGGGGRFASADVTDAMGGCASKIVKKAIAGGGRIVAVRAAGFAGMLGYEPHEGVRLGREVAQAVRPYGIGGVFHTDELPAYGISAGDVEAASRAAGAGPGDALLLLAAPPAVAAAAAGQVIARLEQALLGAPAETRQAQPDGTTTYLRPRPGPARMYPETDIPPVMVTGGDLDEAAAAAPPPWEDLVAGLAERLGLNAQLAEQALDSGRAALLERVCADRRVPPNFAASSICSTLASLQKKDGLDAGRLPDSEIAETFAMLADGRITKEAVAIIFEKIMAGESEAAGDAAGGQGPAGDDEISRIIDEVVAERGDYIDKAGERAAKPLMGAAMARLRGRARGGDVSRMLDDKIRARLAARDGKDKSA